MGHLITKVEKRICCRGLVLSRCCTLTTQWRPVSGEDIEQTLLVYLIRGVLDSNSSFSDKTPNPQKKKEIKKNISRANVKNRNTSLGTL